MQMFGCSEVRGCADVRGVFRCSDFEMFRCSDVQMFGFSDVKMFGDIPIAGMWLAERYVLALQGYSCCCSFSCLPSFLILFLSLFFFDLSLLPSLIFFFDLALLLSFPPSILH